MTSGGLSEPLLISNARLVIRFGATWALSLVGIAVMALSIWTLAQPDALSAEPVARRKEWYDGIESVHVFYPGDAVAEFSWDLYDDGTGCDTTGEFSPHRHALLLTAGSYTDTITVGYYTSLVGVGASADDVQIESFETHNRNCVDDAPLSCNLGGGCSDGLTNFWRSVDGLSTRGNATWAASQAAPLRRVHVQGSLSLSEHAPVSGGFISDSVVEGGLEMGLQQQHLVRNCELSRGAVGTYMNYVFLGVHGAPAPAENGRVSVLDTTPRVAAKPFLREDAGEWSIVVPARIEGSRGPLGWDVPRAFSQQSQSDAISFADVFVARAGDTVASIHAGIAGKRALLLTPAVYSLEEPLTVTAKGFVVLGIGFPTLVATMGRSALVIAADSVRVSGVLLESGTSVASTTTEPLMRWVGSDGVGNDLFSRVGAFSYTTANKPSCLQTRADVHMSIEGDDITLDNTWLWHADHDDCHGLSDTSYSKHGLHVSGARTIAIGLQVEHQMEDLVLWSGEQGETYMFQAELPYKYANFTSVGYHVEASVREHTVLGGGVYGIGNLYPIKVGIRLPQTATAHNLFAWAIAAAPKYLPDHSRFGDVLCTSTGAGGAETCYTGQCDFVACFVTSLGSSDSSVLTTSSAHVPTVHVPPRGSWRGVSLGGWLVMEINPSKIGPSASPDARPGWMFDQVQAASELDFVIHLRASGGDSHAIETMKNHWAGFITEADLDGARALGVNAVRIPVGYWITEAPVGGSSPFEYGFSHEGFVTGGLNHLRDMLRKLRARHITAVLDMHSLPCGQACVSNGLSCDAPLVFSPNRTKVSTAGIPRCRGGGTLAQSGVYPTSREPGVAWFDVAVDSVVNLARWIALLPHDEASVISALQIANEPALNTAGCMEPIKQFYREALAATRKVLPTLPLVLNFIYPNSGGLDVFMAEVQAWGGALVLDQHWYLK